jgi:hypothetical protein
MHCVFKTELVTHLLTQTHGSIQVIISPTYVPRYLIWIRLTKVSCDSIEYTKKKEKKDVVKFVKDEQAQHDDNYKSHTVHVASGEPPNSVSNPMPKRKEGVVRPITQGKLLKKGGPSVRVMFQYRLFPTHLLSRNPLRQSLNLLLSHFPVNQLPLPRSFLQLLPLCHPL